MAATSIPLQITSITTCFKARYPPPSSPPEAKDQDEHLRHHDVCIHSHVVPLTIFDRVEFDRLTGVVFAFTPPMPTNEVMKESLSKALSYYPHLSGRLSNSSRSDIGRRCLHLNNAGIRLVEASSPITLEEVLPLDPSAIGNVDDLLPPLHFAEELLYVQLNRFACGGLVIGIAANHSVADGRSMSHFFQSWARLVRGLELEQPPYHDRAAVSVTRSPPRCPFDHEQIEFKVIPPLPSGEISLLPLHFSANFVGKLKAKATNDDNSRRCSTFRCLIAHLWKKFTATRGLDDDQLTHVRIAVDGRPRLTDPPVPGEYFGNLILWATPRLRAGEVLSLSYSEVTDVIHDAVAKIDEAYFKSFIDYAEVLKAEGREDAVIPTPGGDVMCPNLEVDSWLTFKFHELDFGGGPPSVFTVPPSMAMDGLLFLLPSCVNKGDVDALVGVVRHHADRFMQCVMDVD